MSERDRREIEHLLKWKEWIVKEYWSWSEEKREKWIMDRWKGEEERRKLGYEE